MWFRKRDITAPASLMTVCLNVEVIGGQLFGDRVPVKSAPPTGRVWPLQSHFRWGSPKVQRARLRVSYWRKRENIFVNISTQRVRRSGVHVLQRFLTILLMSVAKVTPLLGFSWELLLLPPREFLLMMPEGKKNKLSLTYLDENFDSLEGK